MFINFSNHPHAVWPKKELDAAAVWGNITDIAFPAVKAESSEEEVLRLAVEYLKKIPNPANDIPANNIWANNSDAVMVTGEYSFVYAIVDTLLDKGCRVVCPESEVKVTNTPGPNGAMERKLVFDFRRFADYSRYSGELKPVTAHQPVFLNCSMHYASSGWDERARTLAEEYGQVRDFPITPLTGTDRERFEKAEGYLKEIDRISPSAVLLDGEFFTFYMMANALIRKGYTVLVKCSDRNTVEQKNADGTVTKVTQYRFVRYRKVSGNR